MRIACNIALILCVLYLPWWIGVLVALVSAFLVDRFFELVLYGMLADVLYGSSFSLNGFSHIGVVYTSLVCAVSLVIRKRLSW